MGTMDTGAVFAGGYCIQCADPVLSDQEDPALVGCDRRESFTGSEEPPGIVPVGMYGVGGNHRDREYHGGRSGCDRRSCSISEETQEIIDARGDFLPGFL